MSSLRKLFKQHLGISHGESCREVEKCLRKQVSVAMRSLSLPDRALVVHQLLPDWVDQVILDSWTKPIADVFMGIAPPVAAEPALGDAPVAAVPALEAPRPAPPKRSRSWMSKGFDHYCSLFSEELREAAKKLKCTKRWAKHKIHALMKVAGSGRWKKLSYEDKVL